LLRHTHPTALVLPRSPPSMDRQSAPACQQNRQHPALPTSARGPRR
jgi:hypothetical protein